MGKVLVIKNADFSVNAIDKIYISEWTKLTLSNGNWLPNHNDGSLSPETRDNLWASGAILIDNYTKMCGFSSVSKKTKVMFYSDLPTSSTASSLFVGAWKGGSSDPIYTEKSPGTIPTGAKYAVIFDEGSGANTYGVTSEYYAM